MAKIDIISGFLGAGKTTLIKKMIDEVYKGEKIVLIENEFGEVGIDGGFLKDAGIEISEMNSGCICCSLVGDFAKNLHEVINRFSPDRILIEPSGVGKLSDVMASVIDIEKTEDVTLNALVTVVNALKGSKQMKAFGEFFNNQIECATTIVLSRTQKAKESDIEKLVKEIQAHNDKAAIITTPWDEISGEAILKVLEGKNTLNSEMKSLAEKMHKEHEHEHHHHDHHEHHEHHEHHHHEHHDHEEHEHHDHEEREHHHEHHHHHHADEIFTSWGIETPHKFDKATIENAMKKFVDTTEYGEIIRSKGMVPATDGTWIYFDLVDGEYELRSGESDYTGKIVVIGTDVEEDKLRTLFGI